MINLNRIFVKPKKSIGKEETNISTTRGAIIEIKGKPKPTFDDYELEPKN